MSIVSAAGTFGKPRHGHDVAGQHDHETGPGRNPHVAQRNVEVLGPALQPGSVESEYCVLAMQIGSCAVARLLKLLELVAELLVGQHVGGAVDLAADDAHLLPEVQVSG